MEKRYNYFAYGSNMDTARMLARCPSARLVGKATLRGYRLVERLYADIEPAGGRVAEGVVWTVTAADLRRLDGFEGVGSGCYRRRVYTIVINGRTYGAYGYEMTPETRRVRDGRPYPDEYRRLCSRGACAHGVADSFGSTRKGA